MGVTASISAAVIAAAGTTHSIVSSNKNRQESQAAADLQRKGQETLLSKERATELAEQESQTAAAKLAKERAGIAAKGGFTSTVAGGGTLIGSAGPSQGQKTLIGS